VQQSLKKSVCTAAPFCWRIACGQPNRWACCWDVSCPYGAIFGALSEVQFHSYTAVENLACSKHALCLAKQATQNNVAHGNSCAWECILLYALGFDVLCIIAGETVSSEATTSGRLESKIGKQRHTSIV
jgi:hypothetical protein